MVAVNILLGCTIGFAAAIALVLNGMPGAQGVAFYFLTATLALVLSLQHLRHLPVAPAEE